MELEDLEHIISELDKNASNLTLKEKSSHAVGLLKEVAAKKDIVLELRKKK